jgi:hypothetical protein
MAALSNFSLHFEPFDSGLLAAFASGHGRRELPSLPKSTKLSEASRLLSFKNSQILAIDLSHYF